MKISFLKKTDKANLVAFNTKFFSNRSIASQDLIDFRYFNPLNKEDFLENNIIASNDENQIIGQALYHPAKYYFENQLHAMEWGFDLFVDPNSRTESIGLHLFDFIKQNKTTPIFATGVGEKALKIEKFYGYHIIGELKKYYKIINPLFFLTSLFRAKYINVKKFPKFLGVDKGFEKISLENLWNQTIPYNKELLEFERDEKFLKWRFYSNNSNYVVYKKNNSSQDNQVPIYFVVRTVKIKKLTVLVLVDYRFDIKNSQDFEIITKAVNKIASKMFLPIVVTGSSNKISDQILDANGYKVSGRDRPIICNIKDYKVFKDKIIDRNFLFCTFADSDGEYLL